MDCFKCGKKIPDGELFCVECSLTPAAPVVTPSQKSPPKAKRTGKKAGAHEAKKHAKPMKEEAKHRVASNRQKSSKGKTIGMSIVSIVALVSLCFIAVTYVPFTIEKGKLRAKEANILLREREMDTLEETIELLTAQNATAEKNQELLAKELSALQEQIMGRESDAFQAEYDMTSQLQELKRLSQENIELLQLVDNLELDTEMMTKQIGSLRASNVDAKGKADFLEKYVVLVNNDESTDYHKYGCTLFDEDSFWAYSRKLAESNGYAPCPVCS